MTQPGLARAIPPQLQQAMRLGLAAILTASLVLAMSFPSDAQFSLPEGLGQNTRSNSPPGVTRYGNIEVAPVDSPTTGRILFEVASPTVYDRSTEGAAATLAVEQRAQEVEDRLWRVIDRPMNPETLEVAVSRLNNVTVIVAQDDEYTQPLTLVSVTGKDADFQGKPVDQVAEEWRGILADDLRTGLSQFSPEALATNLTKALRALGWLAALTVAVLGVKYGVSYRQKRLHQHQRQLNEARTAKGAAPVVDPQQTKPPMLAEEILVQKQNQFLQSLSQTLSLQRRIGLWSLVQWLLFWGLILAWYIGLFWIMDQIPPLTRFKGYILGRPVELLAVWFITSLAIRLSRRLIDRLKDAWQTYEFIDLGDAQRRQLRTSTISGAVKGMASVLIAATGLLWALNLFGIPTGSVLALGGLLGLAISFGSQSLVKDLVNGCLILAEDQFAIGDVVDLGHVAGLVENLNLRVTQLRSGDGELITIPNSVITEVKNLTRTWSRVNFSIDVAYHTDPEKALAVLREVTKGLYDDPDWHDKMLAPPDVLGIDSVSHSGMTLTTWIQTAPAQQWAVGREFRLRVRQALEDNDIDIGIPQQAYSGMVIKDNNQARNGSSSLAEPTPNRAKD